MDDSCGISPAGWISEVPVCEAGAKTNCKGRKKTENCLREFHLVIIFKGKCRKGRMEAICLQLIFIVR
jgi:hypothetical protein